MTAGTSGPSLGIDEFRLLERAQGAFGDLMICDDAACRSLWCEAQCLGSLYLEPAAACGGPGPVPEASYVLGWLMAVLPQPRARILMGGLGCGAGVVALLHHFPTCLIEVVEIDPVVVHLARRHVPLLSEWEAAGRVIIQVEPIETVAARGGCWDFALLDCFQYGTEAFVPDCVLADLRRCCREVWLNVVDDEPGTRTQRWAARFRAHGWTTPTAMKLWQVDCGVTYFGGNYLLGTAALAADMLHRFKPFDDLAGEAVDTARACFSATVAAFFSESPAASAASAESAESARAAPPASLA